jgi:predicted regulator of Ras-like GTPase activity (Roadblock/LC7/MglB family)
MRPGNRYLSRLSTGSAAEITIQAQEVNVLLLGVEETLEIASVLMRYPLTMIAIKARAVDFYS